MRDNERGAVLLHVLTGLIVFVGISALGLDIGVMWAARSGAQTAADAGAMAGAISRAWDDPDDPPAVGGIAYNAMIAAAQRNKIWGDVPGSFVINWARPNGVPAFIDGKFAHIEVFKNGENGSTRVPTYFMQILGISTQGVKAYATAVAAYANGTNCMRPWMVPDKWQEITAPATSFNGSDVYTPPDDRGLGGTGYTIADKGTIITFHPGDPHAAISPSDYYDVDLSGRGGHAYQDDITNCSGVSVGLGTMLTVEPGGQVGPTKHGVQDLIAKDPYATWNGTEVVGSCCATSPRVIPIAMFNPAAFNLQDRQSGRFDLEVVNMMGFFMLGIDNGGNVQGVLMALPGELFSNITKRVTTVQKVILVR